MALNFVGYINTTSSASTAEKSRFLDDFCYGLGYSDTMKDIAGNTVPNPETKAQFANRAIMEWLKATVKARRYAIAYEVVTVDELNL
jgi:hypothetical protein